MSANRNLDRHFVPEIIVTEIGKERQGRENPPSAGIFSVAGRGGAMQQRFPLKYFRLIELVGHFQVALLDGVEWQLLKRAAEIELRWPPFCTCRPIIDLMASTIPSIV